VTSSSISNGAYSGWNFPADRDIEIYQVTVFPNGGSEGEDVLVAVENKDGEWDVIKGEVH
jgi:hypothetical protein